LAIVIPVPETYSSPSGPTASVPQYGSPATVLHGTNDCPPSYDRVKLPLHELNDEFHDA
jgi:hypothetical protein